MPRYEHKKIAEQLLNLDQLPSDQEALSAWITAADHIDFLTQNAKAHEMVVYASPEYSFVHSLAVPEGKLYPLDKDDLMGWSTNPHVSAASYVSGGGREGTWVERRVNHTGSDTLSHATHLIYGRTFEGMEGDDRNYIELSQEYAHLEGLHWKPEQRGYCRFDENGDLVPIVSVTTRSSQEDLSLVTFDWGSLEYYLTCSKQVLVRLFDFTLLDHSKFSGWGKGEVDLRYDSDDLFYLQNVQGQCAYTRGVQIVRPRRPKEEIFQSQGVALTRNTNKKHVELIAHDWRNNRIRKISTDPEATTNYFEAKDNDLPFELSPAFFKPDVLLKYKADKDKYTIQERKIHCRAAWCLDAYDVNEAGQVFAYICYLRRLPESELLHWLSNNEEPKASISKRALVNDFEGKFVSFISPLEKIKGIARAWDRKRHAWWTLKDERLIDGVTVPLTASRDEWGESFLALAQLINEGFVVKEIRKSLGAAGVDFEKSEGSLSLLEKLINSKDEIEEPLGLSGLRTTQLIRTKVKGHSAKSDAENLAQEAITEHETYSAHFLSVCESVIDDLEIIQSQFT